MLNYALNINDSKRFVKYYQEEKISWKKYKDNKF